MNVIIKPELKLVPFENIETERLLLRRFTPDDAQVMFDTWASDPDVTRYMTWLPHPDTNETRDIIEKWMKRYETCATELCEVNYAITIKVRHIYPRVHGKLIGSIGLVPRERNASVEIGYCTGKAFWGHGYVTEAARALVTLAFDRMNAQKVIAFHHPENAASGRVMQKCGMKREGILRKDFFAPALGMCDAVTYSILREEYYSS